jgi:hypothetical protein
MRRVITSAQQAVREALRRHKRLGNPIAVSRDGKVVVVPARHIKA